MKKELVQLTIRLTPEEKLELIVNAKKEKVSINTYVRQSLLKKEQDNEIKLLMYQVSKLLKIHKDRGWLK